MDRQPPSYPSGQALMPSGGQNLTQGSSQANQGVPVFASQPFPNAGHALVPNGGSNLPQGGHQANPAAQAFTPYMANGFGAPLPPPAPPTIYYVHQPAPQQLAPQPAPAQPAAPPPAAPLQPVGQRRIAVYDVQLRMEVGHIRELLQQLLHAMQHGTRASHNNRRRRNRDRRGVDHNRRNHGSDRRDPPGGDGEHEGEGGGGVVA